MERSPFNARRDAIAPRLAELARMLEKPTPTNLEKVRQELERLARE